LNSWSTPVRPTPRQGLRVQLRKKSEQTKERVCRFEVILNSTSVGCQASCGSLFLPPGYKVISPFLQFSSQSESADPFAGVGLCLPDPTGIV
jgi:hypothetical protein